MDAGGTVSVSVTPVSAAISLSSLRQVSATVSQSSAGPAVSMTRVFRYDTSTTRKSTVITVRRVEDRASYE